MMNAVDAVSRQTQGERAAALAIYKRLLSKAEISDTETADLRREMAVLGKTPTDLASDVQAVQQMRYLRSAIAAGVGAEADSARDKSNEALAAHDRRTAQINEELGRERARLDAEAREIEQKFWMAIQSRQELDSWRRPTARFSPERNSESETETPHSAPTTQPMRRGGRRPIRIATPRPCADTTWR
jgi:chromosome segregation ATPase